MKWLATCMLAVLLLVPFGATSGAASRPFPSSESDVISALERLFEARCTVITGGSAHQLTEAYAKVSEAANRAAYDGIYLVKFYVEPYAYNQYDLTNCRYELRDIQISVTGGKADVSVRPLLKYDWGRAEWGKYITAQEGEGVHHITFSLATAPPKIIMHEYEDFFHGHLPTEPFRPGEIVVEHVNPHIKPEGAQPKSKTSQSGDPSLLAAGDDWYTYDRQAAADYAWSWAYSFNTTEYPKYDHDCTNFVSQAIRDNNGGWVPYVRNVSADNDWYVNSGLFGWSTSPTWRLVINFRNMLLTQNYGPHGSEFFSANNLSVGDVIIYDFAATHYNTDAAWDHATMVTSKAPDGAPIIAYHSTETRDRGWNTFPFQRASLIHLDDSFKYPAGTGWN